jgi:hypothetical protein
MEVNGQLLAPPALPPGEKTPGTHWLGDWVGPRAVVDAVVKRKIPSPRRESNPDHPVRSLVSILIEVYQLPQFYLKYFLFGLYFKNGNAK